MALSSRHITKRDIQIAQRSFEANEPRDLFYRAATELVELSLRGQTSLTLAEALAVLLQTWNKSYYRFRRFDTKHLEDIENLLKDNRNKLIELRGMNIKELRSDQAVGIRRLFKAFEKVLGPVGAAKTLHLLAPRFFPLWDRTIAYEYGFELGRVGSNAEKYWDFMLVTKRQCVHLGGEKGIGKNPLKAIDEYNYCKYTQEWI